jgi:hypothetical protein
MVFPRRTPFDSSRIDETTGLRKVFMRAGSPHPPQLESDRDAEDYEDPYDVEVRKGTRRSQLAALAKEIRAKSQWYFKIIQQKDLVEKWVVESQLEDGADLQELIL